MGVKEFFKPTKFKIWFFIIYFLFFNIINFIINYSDTFIFEITYEILRLPWKYLPDNYLVIIPIMYIVACVVAYFIEKKSKQGLK